MQRLLIGVAALAAVAALFAGLSLRAQTGAQAPAAGAVALPLGASLNRLPPPVALRGPRGSRTSLRSLRGRWVALAPTLTSCHEVCPIATGALMRLRTLMRRMG